MIFGSARHCTSNASRPYALEPGFATIRSATSFWNIKVRLSQNGGHLGVDSQRTSNSVPTL